MAQKIKPPSCPLGYTRADLETIFSVVELEKFNHWMVGQTGAICEGRRYSYEDKVYHLDACWNSPHGCVIYVWDVQRYIDGDRYFD